ncbi:hypothetical protein ACS0TY_032856 [Phlomoides rotata]
MKAVSIRVIHAGEFMAAPPYPAQQPPHNVISTPAPRFAIGPVPRQIVSINERCCRPRCQSMTRHEELPVPVFKPLEQSNPPPHSAISTPAPFQFNHQASIWLPQNNVVTLSRPSPLVSPPQGSEAASDKKPKWSARSIKSFAMGELEARKLKFPNTGTEALLMGILVEGTSLTAKFLRENEIVKLLGKSDMCFFSPEHPLLTEPAQKTLDWAVDEKLKTGAMAGQKVATNIGGFIVKKPFQQTNVVSKQKSQTLDSIFANMKEQRMRVFSQQHNNNVPKRNGGGQPRVPWARNHLRN